MMRAASKRRHLTDDQRAMLANEEREAFALFRTSLRWRLPPPTGTREEETVTADAGCTPCFLHSCL
jgi:hypothetical protein